ncbi:Hypothetical predicted protein [Olea europaea subsp. europaea]|uniref:Uncharacterized protein n=1 Tax=Olea europaea subsp. europaea TaxID=158383 RepID=A0A8S0PNA1_OLEEU|nr:Hypothetical predicted protein [Olea europaea subsp. europaea]
MKRPVDFSETPFDRGSSRNKNASCRVLSTAKGVVQARVRDNHMICLTGIQKKDADTFRGLVWTEVS